MPIVQREWRIVYRVFDDRIEIRVPGFYPRDEALEVAQRALREDGWIKVTDDPVVPPMISMTRVLRV